ncbi:MAG: HAMP domain-containing protein [Alphaproteobacteria bacterium]|nr:HAMP domain-containing protein [Alphaproteobacteria bacterium]
MLVLLAAATIPLFALLAYAIYSSAATGVVLAKSTARNLAKITASDTDRIIRTNREALARIALRPMIRTAALGHCDDFLNDFHAVFPVFANATVIDPTGLAVCSAVAQPGGKPVNVAKAEWFQRAQASQDFVVGRPFLGPITGRWVSVLISPIRGERGDISGYLGFPIDLAAYRPSVSQADLGEYVTVGILDDQSTLIWRNIDPENWVGKNLAHMSASQRMMAGEREFTETGVDGIERVYFVESLTEADWHVFVGMPKHTLYQGAIRNGLINAGIGIVVLVLVLALAARIGHRISSPMRKLAQVAAGIKKGDVALRAALAGPRELVEVAREFNAMIEVREDQRRRMSEREEALRQSNAELERFAYVASHDLQTPLRNIASYSQLLERRYKGRLDQDADQFITFIVDGAKHMSRLINDLLSYSRITSQGRPLVPVSAHQAAALALADLQLVIAEAGGQVELVPLPEVLADEPQLVSLFQNLIGNAIKYRAAGRPPVVRISVGDHSASHWIFMVADNGIGIESQYFGKIFELFQRLSPSGDVDGTGIGLALCQRLVTRFGGTIGVDSIPGQGSTFWFTLLKVGDPR